MYRAAMKEGEVFPRHFDEDPGRSQRNQATPVPPGQLLDQTGQCDPFDLEACF